MACSLGTYSSSNQNSNHTLSPRISFSNDFVEAHQHMAKPRSEAQSPPSADFEFSVPSYSMITADELFFKGKFLPFRDQLQRPTTLREELLMEDEDGDNKISFGPKKGTQRWKEILGLKKIHNESVVKSLGPVHGQEAQVSNSSQVSGVMQK